jgi:hypothetical protein
MHTVARAATLNLPAGHNVHAGLPEPDEYSNAPQSMHAVATAREYVPATQVAHVAPVLYCPGAQSPHTVLPELEYLPPGQFRHGYVSRVIPTIPGHSFAQWRQQLEHEFHPSLCAFMHDPECSAVFILGQPIPW